MTKHQEALFVLVHSPLWPVFIEYKQDELDKAHKALEWQTGDEFLRTQGVIQEIRRDLGLMKKLEELSQIK